MPANMGDVIRLARPGIYGKSVCNNMDAEAFHCRWKPSLTLYFHVAKLKAQRNDIPLRPPVPVFRYFPK